mmetsp:Transcript_13712/g.27270  ORF Transcript_13712/g.27270 Transcript_13712/m.27270 type:complete len:105 (+) Transcript_13712:129-443(+)
MYFFLECPPSLPSILFFLSLHSLPPTLARRVNSCGMSKECTERSKQADYGLASKRSVKQGKRVKACKHHASSLAGLKRGTRARISNQLRGKNAKGPSRCRTKSH